MDQPTPVPPSVPAPAAADTPASRSVPLSVTDLLTRLGVAGGVTLDGSGTPDHSLDQAAATAAIRSLSGRYTVGDVVARGGMGTILSARDLNVRRQVAMKVMLNPESTGKDRVLRFIEEAQVTGQLEHPGVVPVHELGVDTDGKVYYTMKMVRGTTLREVLSRLAEGDKAALARYSLNPLLNLFQRVCDAVAFAHSKGVIHRDLKPENIMVGDFGEVYVMDWGLAKVLPQVPGLAAQASGKGDGEPLDPGSVAMPAGVSEERVEALTANPEHGDETFATKEGKAYGDGRRVPRQPRGHPSIESTRAESAGAAVTLDGTVMGTPAFMAPEQAQGRIAELDARSDVYALGAVLYSILTLRPPVEDTHAGDVLAKVINGAIVPPVGHGLAAGSLALAHCPGGRVPEALSAVAMKALSRAPADRYPTVKALQAEIEAWLGGFATAVEQAGLWRQLVLLVNRNRTFAVVVLLSALVHVVGLGVALVQRHKAISALQSNIVLRQTAESARDSEAKLRESAEYDAYVATIGLVGTCIENGEFAVAEPLLDKCSPRYRNWEWGYLKALCHQERLRVPLEQRSLAVAYTPDGTSILCGQPGRVLQVDRVSGQTLRTFAQTPSPAASGSTCPDVRGIACSADGTRLAMATEDGTISIWDLASGAMLRTLQDSDTGTLGVAFSPSANVLVAWNLHRQLSAWDAGTGTLTFSVNMAMTALAQCGVAFVNQGRSIVCVSSHTLEILLLDAATGKTVSTYKTGNTPYSVALAPDHRTVLVGCDKVSELWDLDSGRRIRGFDHPKVIAESCRLTPDSRYAIILGREDQAVRVYALETAELLREFRGHGSYTSGLDVSPDGLEIATGSNDRTVRFWELHGPEPCRRVGESGQTDCAAFLGDGKLLVYVNKVPQQIGVVADVDTCNILDRRTFPTSPQWYSWTPAPPSPDGRLLLTYAEQENGEHQIDVWDLVEKRVVSSFSRHTDTVRAARFLPDSRRIVSGGLDKKVRLWDATTGAELWCRPFRSGSDRDEVLRLTVSPGGRRILVAGEEGAEMRIVESGVLEFTVGGYAAGLYGCAFSPDGSRIFVGDSVFAAADGHKLVSLPGCGTVRCAGFSPDAARIVTGGDDRALRLWDTATGRLLLTLREHPRLVRTVEFSPDGKYLLSAGPESPAFLRRAVDWRAAVQR